MSSPDRPQWRRWPGLRYARGRVVLAFALSSCLVAVVLASAGYLVGSNYMRSERSTAAEELAGAHADALGSELRHNGANGAAAVATVAPPEGTRLALQIRGEWFGDPALAVRPPADSAGSAEQVRVDGTQYLRTVVPIDDADTVLYEYTPVADLESSLRILQLLLIAAALAASALGAGIGIWAGRHALSPMRQVAGTAARIAAGDNQLRLPETRDQDLAVTTDAFNAMVDTLQQRIARERRLVADIGHELRTPLTTLTTSVTVLTRHAEELSTRPRTALGLVTEELDHLRRMLDDLLALARAEAGIHRSDPEPISLRSLLEHTLAGRHYPAELLTVSQDVVVEGRKLELERAVANLLDNAQRHGGGVVQVRLDRVGDDGVIIVDDAGPGVPATDRERIFERFATVDTSRTTSGTGVGLALVSETVSAHHGRVQCLDRPGGGSRFIIRLPAAPEETSSGN